MITKIAKFKNFGIFHDFAWKAAPFGFKKFNLIYGWNSGGQKHISFGLNLSAVISPVE